MVEKDALKSAYLAVMSDMESIINQALNKIWSEMEKDNEAEALQSVLDTAALGNALFALRVVYRAKFEYEEANENE